MVIKLVELEKLGFVALMNSDNTVIEIHGQEYPNELLKELTELYNLDKKDAFDIVDQVSECQVFAAIKKTSF